MPAPSPGELSFSACFEVMVMRHVCAIQAHAQEPCPNDQTLQILFTAFASEGNNCRKNRRTIFFYFLLASSLIFEMSISGGSAKRLLYLFLVPIVK
jgi:hypothetical protein